MQVAEQCSQAVSLQHHSPGPPEICFWLQPQASELDTSKSDMLEHRQALDPPADERRMRPASPGALTELLPDGSTQAASNGSTASQAAIEFAALIQGPTYYNTTPGKSLQALSAITQARLASTTACLCHCSLLPKTIETDNCLNTTEKVPAHDACPATNLNSMAC